MKQLLLSEEQLKKLEKLWFVYGNGGKKCTMPNHRFIQNLIEGSKDYRDFYPITKDCIKAVDEILNQEQKEE